MKDGLFARPVPTFWHTNIEETPTYRVFFVITTTCLPPLSYRKPAFTETLGDSNKMNGLYILNPERRSNSRRHYFRVPEPKTTYVTRWRFFIFWTRILIQEFNYLEWKNVISSNIIFLLLTENYEIFLELPGHVVRELWYSIRRHKCLSVST